MPNYTILVRRTQCAALEFTVAADCALDAEELALQKAYNIDWSDRQYDTEYEAECESPAEGN